MEQRQRDYFRVKYDLFYKFPILLFYNLNSKFLIFQPDLHL